MELRLELDGEEEQTLLNSGTKHQDINHNNQKVQTVTSIPLLQPSSNLYKSQSTNQQVNVAAFIGMDRQVKFSSLCDLFEKSLEKTQNERLQLLKKLWKSLKDPNDYYPFMRLLLPQLDKERMTYGLKESKIAKYLVEILCVKPNCDDALRLKKWKDPSLSKGFNGNSFSDTVFNILKKRGWGNKIEGKKPLSIYDVNKLLDSLCATTDV